MSSLFLFVALLLPTLAVGKCPHFQAIIPLRQRATAHDWTFAVVADGKYHLINSKDRSSEYLDGPMPTGFEWNSLTTAIDANDCVEPQYYLITIKSFRSSGRPIETLYSTLDLLNWTISSQWSEPKPIVEHPMLSQYKTLMTMVSFNPIQDKVKTIFYWDITKSLFFVSEPYESEENEYQIVDTKGICDRSYRFFPESSQQFYNFNETLSGSEVSPLDLCYIHNISSHWILFCFNNFSVQANLIELVQPLEHSFTGPLRTVPITSLGHKSNVKVDRLRDISRLCRKPDGSDLLPAFIEQLSPDGSDYADDKLGQTVATSGLNHIIPNLADELKPNADNTDKDSNDMSYTVIIIVVCIVLMVLLVAAIGVTATRRNNQLARM